MAEPVVTMEATTYTFSVLPEDNINYGHYCLTVEKRGPDSWAVLDGRHCLDADGEWAFEMQPSSRADEWLATHRFSLAEAQRLAEVAVRTMTVNGISVGDVLARANRAPGVSE